jgi:hypothetical protein
MEIYTIGFTKKTAAQFFGAPGRADIEQPLDVRLNNVSTSHQALSGGAGSFTAAWSSIRSSRCGR